MQAAPYQKLVPIARQDIEANLKEFVQSALQQSCSKDCSHQEAMALLDRAWESQKLLWRIRWDEPKIAIDLQVSFSIEPQMLQTASELLHVREG